MRGRASYYSKKNGRLPVLVPDGTGNNMVVLLYKKERGTPGRGAPLSYTRVRVRGLLGLGNDELVTLSVDIDDLY